MKSSRGAVPRSKALVKQFDVLRGVWHKEAYAFEPRLQLGLMLSRLLPPLVGNKLRTAILRWAGLQIGRGTIVGGALTVVGRLGPRGLSVGEECIVNGQCLLDVNDPIEIGDRTALAQQVMILTGTHHLGGPERRWGPIRELPVRVGSGVWIGARALILPGVSIGDGSVVAAGSVVTRDVPPNTLVAGAPARVIRELLLASDQ
jgi:maltose O-acetyltransferase